MREALEQRGQRLLAALVDCDLKRLQIGARAQEVQIVRGETVPGGERGGERPEVDGL